MSTPAFMKNWPRSRAYPWAGAGSIPVEMNFLDRALQKYDFPVIDTMWVRLLAQIDVGAAGAPSRLFPQFCKLLTVNDVQDLSFKCSGAVWRAIMQQEYGMGYTDGRNLAVGNNQSIERWFRIPFNPRKATRGYDFGCPALALRGGQMEWTWLDGLTLGGATEITNIDSASVQFFAEIREARKGVIPARITWEEMNITQDDFAYPIDGALRYLLAYVGSVAENAGTAWGAQNIISDTMNIASYPSTFFQEMYFINSNPRVRDPSVTGTTEDMVVNDFIMPAFSPAPNQKLPELPKLGTFHYQTSATITSTNLPRMIKSVVTKRNEDWAVASLRAENYNAVEAMLKRMGRIQSDDGKRQMLSSFKQSLVDIMPITFKAA